MNFFFFVFLFENGIADSSCGYDSCPKPKSGFLNVHLVPHTHDDVGWLKTVDQYYYGSHKDITPVGVQYILDSVIDSLEKDPNRRFIYVEMAFFFRWWSEQNEAQKARVKRLVNQGRLEFISGGWCMNDEAAAHYNAIIDQMTFGMRLLNETFGECGRPKVAWQIDPFGHSREQANLFAEMGFDGLFFGRLDYQDKARRLETKTMEMIWKGRNDPHKNDSWLFTGALFNGYSPPNGFHFDAYTDDDPIMDIPGLKDNNVEFKVDIFLQQVLDQARGYSSNHIMMTMGEDFNYVQADVWFKNLDKLIKYANLRTRETKINVLYSTPSCYIKALNDDALSYTTKKDDFLPYASDPHAYWTGYFTSRPALKDMVRKGNNLLQICKQMAALDRTNNCTFARSVTKMSMAMGVLQHHDAITGTAKQAVTFDYAERLAEGFTECEKVIAQATRNSLSKAKEYPKVEFCRGMNVSECAAVETKRQFLVNIYNPLARKVDKIVRIPLKGNKNGFEVFSGNAQEVIPVQLVPIPKAVKAIPGRKSNATVELVFRSVIMIHIQVTLL